MKVKELIQELEKMPQDARVFFPEVQEEEVKMIVSHKSLYYLEGSKPLEWVSIYVKDCKVFKHWVEKTFKA